MTLSDLEHFRNLLLERQDNINHLLAAGGAIPQADHQKAEVLLSEIKNALGRVENHSFGTCVVCHGEVEMHRLDIQPTSQVCLECITAEQRQQLEEELYLASKIHRALLPQEVSHIEGFDVAVKSLAARTVGGDYYDFFSPTRGDMTRIVIGDAMGKGLPAGLIMSNIQGALRVLSEEIESPSQLMTRLNRWLCHNVSVTKFVSLACIAIGPGSDHTSRLLQANAGHCPPILIRSDGTVERLHPTGGVLGVHEGFAYEECGLELHGGDLLLLYTDGVTEAENATGEMFEEERLVEYMRERRNHKPLEDLLNNLHHEVQQFTGKDEMEDDYTVIALRKLK